MKNIKLLLLLLIFANTVIAQTTPTFELQLNHVALSVKNVDIAADFYKNVLHLNEITNRTEVKGIRWFSLGDGKELHLISTIPTPVTINKAVHFALTTSHFDDFVIGLDTFKINYSDWPGTDHKVSVRADGIKQVFIQDPDGYWIEVNSVAQH